MREITVVIPNYNGIEYLKECLSALEKQEPDTPEFAVLVVDNGSTDGSVSWLTQYESAQQTESILLPENTGFCHAVNVGIQAVKTPYVILLNNDTKVKSSFIKELYQAIQENDKAFSVSAKMLMWDKPELIDDAGDRYCVLGWAFSRGKGKRSEQYDEPVEIFSSCGGAAIYRKTVFEEIGYFDEEHFAYLEDLDIGYRARIHGYRNYYQPAAQVLHFGSASTGSRYNQRKTILSSANNVYVIGKNMPLLQLLWNLPFLLLGFLVKFLFFCGKGMGILYLKGMMTGVKKCFSAAGRKAKVPFRFCRLGHYFAIQGQLYLNTLRLITKS
ncbi:MAG: glycosyltransferase family 2 protein [Lachnospiraceae bacterium]|nr:glycosyltransferase family 2 protein [Lachnospiraceae bacterium]